MSSLKLKVEATWGSRKGAEGGLGGYVGGLNRKQQAGKVPLLDRIIAEVPEQSPSRSSLCQADGRRSYGIRKGHSPRKTDGCTVMSFRHEWKQCCLLQQDVLTNLERAPYQKRLISRSLSTLRPVLSCLLLRDSRTPSTFTCIPVAGWQTCGSRCLFSGASSPGPSSSCRIVHGTHRGDWVRDPGKKPR